MARKRKKVSFYARRIVKVPIRVRFRTSDGRRISFKATKAVKRRRKISF